MRSNLQLVELRGGDQWEGGFDWLFWRVISTFALREGEGNDGSEIG